MLSRMLCHHACGTGGFSHFAGSDRSPECVGMTRVPSIPSVCSSASTTLTAPPHTHPIELRDECAITTIPSVTPREFRSLLSEPTVPGPVSYTHLRAHDTRHDL